MLVIILGLRNIYLLFRRASYPKRFSVYIIGVSGALIKWVTDNDMPEIKNDCSLAY
jgi:hypothetical protein